MSRIWGNSRATIRIGKLRGDWMRSSKRSSRRNARSCRRPARDELKKARMKAPFFTVLIDTYNYGEYIEEAVASALAQDFPAEEREILIVDDGSTDDTQERLGKFGEAIRYLRKPNGGQASAFNFGFENARGEVIALLDADDVWLPDKLGRVCEAFEKNPTAGMVYHRVSRRTGALFCSMRWRGRPAWPSAAAH